jgi:ornithine--oxo-acid transaminase
MTTMTATRPTAPTLVEASPAELERRYGAANYHPLPVTLARGAGVWLFDTEGRRHLDMMSAYSAVSFGHGHPTLVRALVEQAGGLPSRAARSTPTSSARSCAPSAKRPAWPRRCR